MTEIAIHDEMATDISHASLSPVCHEADIAKHPPGPPLTTFLVKRRVAISGLLFAVLVPVQLFVLQVRPRDVFQWTNPLVAGAFLMIVAGLLLRSWAAGTLRKRKQLAVTGPYALIRHPLYVGSLLLVGGFATLVNFHPLLCLALVPLAAIYALAIHSEERHLSRLFPTLWPAYAAVAPRFLPKRLTWPDFSDWSWGLWNYNSEYQAWLGSAAAIVAIKWIEISMAG